jgi:hypothetical protein
MLAVTILCSAADTPGRNESLLWVTSYLPELASIDRPHGPHGSFLSLP